MKYFSFFVLALGRPSVILTMMSSWIWHIFKSALHRAVYTTKTAPIGSHMWIKMPNIFFN